MEEIKVIKPRDNQTRVEKEKEKENYQNL